MLSKILSLRKKIKIIKYKIKEAIVFKIRDLI